MNNMIELVFESLSSLVISDVISFIIQSDDNILNVTIRTSSGKEIINESAEKLRKHLTEHDISWLFINLKNIKSCQESINKPSLMMINLEGVFDISLMFNDEDYKGNDLCEFVYEYAKNLSKQFNVEIFYGGIEPASDLETRIFTGNNFGPLKMGGKDSFIRKTELPEMDLKEKKETLKNLISLFLNKKKDLRDLQVFSWEIIDYFSDADSDNLTLPSELEKAFWYSIWQIQHLADEEHEKDGTLQRELCKCLEYLQNKIPMPEHKYGLRPKMKTIPEEYRAKEQNRLQDQIT